MNSDIGFHFNKLMAMRFFHRDIHRGSIEDLIKQGKKVEKKSISHLEHQIDIDQSWKSRQVL